MQFHMISHIDILINRRCLKLGRDLLRFQASLIRQMLLHVETKADISLIIHIPRYFPLLHVVNGSGCVVKSSLSSGTLLCSSNERLLERDEGKCDGSTAL